MPRVAIVHDWFDCIAGSEKVVQEILNCFPDADLFSLIDNLTDQERREIGDRKVTTSFLQKFPFRKHFRNYLPLMPIAIEQLDLVDYDLVISSSHAFAKGIITGPHQKHVTYVHTPIRYAWDFQNEYLNQRKLRSGIKSSIIRAALHYIRIWDRSTADRPDLYLANSGFVKGRIKKTYNRDAQVIYPPVDVDSFQLTTSKSDYFLAAGRLVPYKRFDLVVDAFREVPHEKLILIGDGPEFKKIKSNAPDNVEMLGFQSDEVLRKHLGDAKAFVFAGCEDFGILPVEAQACGTPVIGFGQGGLRETVVHGHTGLYFQDQTIQSLSEYLKTFLELPQDYFDAQEIRNHALQFSPKVFRKHFMAAVDSVESIDNQTTIEQFDPSTSMFRS